MLRPRALLLAAAAAALALGAVAALAACSEPAPAPSGVFQRGMTLGGWSRDDYARPELGAQLDELRRAGVEWVALTPAWYQATRAAMQIASHPERTPSDESLESAIALARERGMRVFLKPQVDLIGPGWRGEIAFDAERDWAAWFASYRAFLAHYAALAERTGVSLLCVGVELDATRHREADWRAAVRAARERFAGPLVYAANFGRERDIDWWDALDYAGVDAYFPVAGRAGPTLAEALARWEEHAAGLRDWAARIRRPVLFTEIGYRSLAGAGAEPWEWERSGAPSPEEQAVLYRAALSALWDEPWLQGFYWWQWGTLPPAAPREDTHYTPQGKPALEVLREFYARPPWCAESECQRAAAAARVHRDALVVDGHNDVTSWILDYGFDLGMDGADPRKTRAELYWVLGGLLPRPRGDSLRTHTDLRRLTAGGVDAQFFSIFPHTRYVSEPGGAHGRAVAMLEATCEQIRRHPDRLELARTAADVRRIAAAGKIAALLGLEGGHALEDDLGKLRDFQARGIRYVTLTWSNTNGWADSSGDEPRHGGLTDFGREMVREMNRLGVLVDVSHVSDETFADAIETSRAPVIASHSSARALVENPRNLDDGMLRALARNGGVVMVNFGGSFVDARKNGAWNVLADAAANLGPSPVPLALVVDHIEHIAAVAGIDHVGLGSDFDGTVFMPEDARDVSGFPNITAALLAGGHSESDVGKILGGNVLRALEEAEAVAAELRGGEDPPAPQRCGP
jgi:membrane dipeptidase